MKVLLVTPPMTSLNTPYPATPCLTGFLRSRGIEVQQVDWSIKQGQATCFGALLARRWVEQGVIATAYLYVDGHVKAYTGKRKLSECWNSQRRMPLPGVLSH